MNNPEIYIFNSEAGQIIVKGNFFVMQHLGFFTISEKNEDDPDKGIELVEIEET